ncbi:Gldg family protein [Myxococcota bacterium]|nr:Gldg family protein [Myxococcota bacterium]MBU1379762.1 Gldg family protein [Myxococcota bacterium]MBU1498525.1 Gldg family protein [Myxococcota bacterium]
MNRKYIFLINTWATVLLLGANLLLFNVIFSRFTAGRIDITQYKEHSLSPHTLKTIRGLPDKVEIIGVFSTNTHRLLKPLIPRIRDLLESYAQESSGHVAVDLMNPSSDKTIKHLYEEFGIKPFPVPLESKYKKEVKSIYFNIIIKYGDQTVKYVLDDMIDVSETAGELTVKLKDMEQLLTKGIKKASTSFTSIDSALAAAAQPVSITFYRVPKEFLTQIPEKDRKSIDEAGVKLKKAIEKYGKNTIQYKEEETKLRDKILNVEISFLKKKVMFPLFLETADVSKSDVAENLEAGLKRVLPGFTRTLGLALPPPDFDPQMARFGRQPPPSEFAALESLLQSEYEVKNIDLSSGKPPIEVEVLLVARPENYKEKELFAIDQYIMLGGRVIFFMDSSKLDIQALQAGKLSIKPVKSGLNEMLESWGVKVVDQVLSDENNYPYPLPREIQPGLPVIEEVPYPYFVKIVAPKGHGAVNNLAELYFLWPAVLETKKVSGLTIKSMVESSSKSWLQPITGKGLDVTPSHGMKNSSNIATKPYTLAVSVSGKFTSFFKGKSSPLDKKGGPEDKRNPKTDNKTSKESVKPEGRRDESSNSRIIVVSDSDIISEVAMKILERSYQFNLKFLSNLLEWIQSDDEEFVTSAKGLPRPLQEMSESKKSFVQHSIWIGSLLFLILLFLITHILRRRVNL